MPRPFFFLKTLEHNVQLLEKDHRNGAARLSTVDTLDCP